ncbi:MAG: HlyD family type I secretion periplasmic adaptor subunit [Alphaproteobacteria bacterium]|nr:HlyD family type I secretion periplasmic adaptor subunit [Alphaproteobacteria bacterium]
MKNKNPEKQTRYLSQAIQLEEAVNPSIVRSTMLTISIALLAFLGWAGVTKISEIAHTPGEIIPTGNQQVVQHLEGGIVKSIRVKERQMVKKGQIVLTLDGGGSQDDLNRALSRDMALKMQEERLRAFVEGRQPDFSAYGADHPDAVKDQKSFFAGMVKARTEDHKVIEEQIVQKKRLIATYQSDLSTAQDNQRIAGDLYARRMQLNQKGYASDMHLLEAQQNLNNANGDTRQIENKIRMTRSEISEFQNRLKSLGARQQDEMHERLDQIMAELSQNAELVEKLKHRVARLDVRAPTDGLVKGLAVNTIGAVIQPGQTLMEIVPMDEKLVVQIKIPPQHIGHLKPGQDVQVKFSSFDFSRYGFIRGKLQQISATTFSGANGERYYEGRIDLEKDYVGEDQGNIILPGMVVMADIITGRKTILDYLLKPIRNSVKTAFTER